MTERKVVLDPETKENVQAQESLEQVTARAERAEAELAKLKKQTTSPAPGSPTPSSDGQSEKTDGETELRKDSMMAHLLDSLAAGKDIGHYGRLTFAMVARHFMPHEEVLTWLTHDKDFDEAQAEVMLRQVEGKDYNPPRRDRVLEWQAEQEFPIIPDPADPDSGNLYRNLRFPNAIYDHIEHYQEQKLSDEKND